VAKIICPGCGAEIDSEKNTAEFRAAPLDLPPVEDEPGADRSALAIPRRGNAFFKPRKKE